MPPAAAIRMASPRCRYSPCRTRSRLRRHRHQSALRIQGSLQRPAWPATKRGQRARGVVDDVLVNHADRFLKYVSIVLRFDNGGEGGILALLALASRLTRTHPRLAWTVAMLGIFGASLFYGDAIITPAISVLSAVEGLSVARPHSSTGSCRSRLRSWLDFLRSNAAARAPWAICSAASPYCGSALRRWARLRSRKRRRCSRRWTRGTR